MIDSMSHIHRPGTVSARGEHPPAPLRVGGRVLHGDGRMAGWMLGLCVVLLVLVAPAVAVAARGHAFTGTIGKRCVTAPSCGDGELNDPTGVAVNEASDVVYVVDRGDDRVQYFNGATGAYLGQFNGVDSPTGAFIEPESIAVDNSCFVHRPVLTGTACTEYDPSYGDVYVTDPGHEVIDKFTATGGYINQLVGSSSKISPEYFAPGLRSLAVSDTGELWVTRQAHPFERENGTTVEGGFVGILDYSNATVNRLLGYTYVEYTTCIAPGCNDTFEATTLLGPGFGLAVSSGEDVYFPADGDNLPARGRDGSEWSGSVEEWRFSAQPNGAGEKTLTSGQYLTQALDGEDSSGIALEDSTNDVYVDNFTSLARFSPSGELLERFGEGLLEGYATASRASGGIQVVEGPEMGVDGWSNTVFVSEPGVDEIVEFGPEPAGAPTVTGSSTLAKGVTSTGVTVEAQVNPRSEPGEGSTRYWLEYGPCSGASCGVSPYPESTPVPADQLVADYDSTQVSVDVGGLSPSTVYHARVVAENGHGRVVGEEVTFTTWLTSGGFALPDGRAYELVSPSEKYGAEAEAMLAEGNDIQAAADGEGIAYDASGPFESEPAGNRGPDSTQILSVRTSHGWSSRDLQTPDNPAKTSSNEFGPHVGHLSEYYLFSSDLSVALLQPEAESPLPPLSEDSQETVYLRNNSTGEYDPLVTAENVSGCGECEFGAHSADGQGVDVEGATPDLGHVVLTDYDVPLVEGAPKGALYEWTGGRLQAVSVLPAGEGGTIVGGAPELGDNNDNVRNAISEEGSRVVWQTQGGSLYLRQTTGTGETVKIGPNQAKHSAVFQIASVSGSRVFFTEHDAGNGADEGELYVFTTGSSGSSVLLAGDVQGSVIGASEGGSVVYFVSSAVLGGVVANANGEVAGVGADNLYVDRYDPETGAWRPTFIAVLSSTDGDDWSESLSHLSARVSPNGDFLAFMSERPLTGYDNRDLRSGALDEEVYEYSTSSTGSGSGELACASCVPSGERPTGMIYNTVNGGPLFDRAGVWGEHWVAGYVPGWTQHANGLALYQSRYLSDSGRLFFDSVGPLVPADGNGMTDVYEFEPVGVGSCSEGSSGDGSFVFVEREGGCVGLISSGTSSEESVFLDASVSGDDVFFVTSAQLVRADRDSAYDVYDARVEGGFGEEAVRASCEGDACQSPAVEPSVQTPASLTFVGSGGLAPPLVSTTPVSAPKPLSRAQLLARALKACKKNRAKGRRRRCEASARSKYGPKKAKTGKKKAKASERTKRGGK